MTIAICSQIYTDWKAKKQAADARYRASDKRKAALHRYDTSPKGKAKQLRHKAARVERGQCRCCGRKLMDGAQTGVTCVVCYEHSLRRNLEWDNFF